MNCKFCKKSLPEVVLFSSIDYGQCDCGCYEYVFSCVESDYWPKVLSGEPKVVVKMLLHPVVNQ